MLRIFLCFFSFYLISATYVKQNSINYDFFAIYEKICFINKKQDLNLRSKNN